jgi:uncharacterized protein (TIGR03067 family)
MMCVRPLLVLILIVPTALAEDKAGDAKAIQGTWVFVSREMIGKKSTAADLKGGKIVIKDDSFVVVDGKKRDKHTFKLDPSKKPKVIDLTTADGKTFTPAIYELKGDTLKICWSEKFPDERPTKIAGDADSGQTVVILKREKK